MLFINPPPQSWLRSKNYITRTVKKYAKVLSGFSFDIKNIGYLKSRIHAILKSKIHWVVELAVWMFDQYNSNNKRQIPKLLL